MKSWLSYTFEGLLPAIIQDNITGKVLMMGYLNTAALHTTVMLNKVTFFSRSKQRLWTKGETSHNYLIPVNIALDCDKDTFLIQAVPQGPVCHTGSDTCWNEDNTHDNFLLTIEKIIADRKYNPNNSSYTSSLFQKGINKIAQKVGEEAVEVVIEAKDNDDELFLNECADLLFHYIILLHAKNKTLQDVVDILKQRHK